MARRRKSNKATGPASTEGRGEPAEPEEPSTSDPSDPSEQDPPVRRRIFTYALADMPVRRDS